MLRIIISMIILSLLFGCTKYETPSQRYLRELSEGYAKEDIERERRYAARAKEDKFSFYGVQIDDPKNDSIFVRTKGGGFMFYQSKMNKDIDNKRGRYPFINN